MSKVPVNIELPVKGADALALLEQLQAATEEEVEAFSHLQACMTHRDDAKDHLNATRNDEWATLPGSNDKARESTFRSQNTELFEVLARNEADWRDANVRYHTASARAKAARLTVRLLASVEDA